MADPWNLWNGARPPYRVAPGLADNGQRPDWGEVSIPENLVCRFRPNGVLTFVNQAYGDYVGQPTLALVGRLLIDGVPPAAHPVVNTLLGQLQRLTPEHPHLIGEYPLLRPDGSVGNQRWHHLAWFDHHDKLIELMAIGHPLAAVAAETVTAPDHGHLLDLFFAQGIDGFFFMMLDQPLVWPDATNPVAALDYAFTHHRLTKANTAFCDQYLAPAEELLGRPIADFFAYDREAGRATLKQLLDNGQLHIEIQEQRLDGSIIWVEGDYICLYDEQGRITGHFGVQRDITDLKQAVMALQASEQRLRESEERLHTALAAAQMGTWEWHIQTGQMFLCESLQQLMGMAPGSFDNRFDTVQQMMHPDDRPRVLAAVQRTIEEGGDYSVELRFIRADGSLRWALVKGDLQRDPQGNPVLLRGVDVDITDRKHTELKLRESETRFHNVVRNVPGAIFRYVLHQDGTDSIGEMNQGCYDIWEVEPAAVITNAAQIWAMVHPADRDRMWHLIQQSAVTLQPWFCEWRITTPSGRQKWLQGIGRPERLANGDTAWDTLILDRSDRKSTELALSQTTAQLKSFIANTPALVTLIDSQGYYLEVNQAVADQFYRQPEEMAGLHLSEVLPAAVLDTFLARIRQVIATQTPLTVEDRLALPQGEKVFSTLLFPITAANPEGEGAIGAIATDVTPLVEAQIVSRRQAEEERLVRMITQHIHQSLDLQEILQTTVTEVRQLLQTDRVLIYRFNSDWSGDMIVESVLPPWQAVLGTHVQDPCFGDKLIGQYQQGRVGQIEDILASNQSQCHKDLLTQFQVRANLTVPINVQGALWGLLCVHHCRAPRPWQAQEVSLLTQLADQVAIALHQSQLLTHTAALAQQEKLLNDIISAISDSLELEDLLERAVSAMLNVFQVSRSLVCLCQPTDKVLIHTMTVAAPGIADLGKTIVPIVGNPHAQAVLTQEAPVAVDDVNQEPMMAPVRDLAQTLQINAMLAVSIRYRGEVKGILSLQQCHQPRCWSTEEMLLLKRVADHLAVGIQQAELYQQAQTELTERKRLEAQLRHEALHDKLTALPNRVFFLNRLSEALEQLHRHCEDHPSLLNVQGPSQLDRTCCSHQFAVLFLDLDRFKVINDSLGHMVGDHLLKVVAQRLQTCLRPMDTAARLGGDEFVVLLAELADARIAIDLARRIHTALETPILLAGYEVFIQASIGIALSAPTYTDPNQVLRDADIAMYQAKASGREYAIFDTPMHTLAVQQMQIENDLRRALDRQEFILYYQPIIDLTTLRIQGFEALIRWQHPDWGLVPPLEFIPVAENTGLITTLDLWTLNQACQQLRQWQQQFPDLDLSVSVNLSGNQFVRPDLMPQIDRALMTNGLSGHYLKIEITESVLIQNAQMAIELLRELRHRQIQICMDDFGTGYSSLSYLHRFPIDVLKIDQSFITNLQDSTHGPSDYAIVKAILSLAKSLKLAVVAEGIETIEQMNYLRANQCQSGQGYYFSKPMSVQDAQGFLAQQSQQSA